MSRDGLDPVALWNIEEPWRSRLRAHLLPVIPVAHVASMPELCEHLRQYPLTAVVVGLSTARFVAVQGAPVRNVISIAKEYPDRAMAVIVTGSHRLDEDSTVALAGVGVSQVFHVTTGGSSGIGPIAAWARAHRPQRLPLLVWAAMETPLDPLAERLYKTALRLALGSRTVDELAAAYGCSPRTLNRLCHEARVGPPLRLKGVSRLLTVGFLMDRPGARLQDVAIQLGFESPEALRLKLTRWTGRTASDMKRRGWLATLRPLLRAADTSDSDQH